MADFTERQMQDAARKALTGDPAAIKFLESQSAALSGGNAALPAAPAATAQSGPWNAYAATTNEPAPDLKPWELYAKPATPTQSKPWEDFASPENFTLEQKRAIALGHARQRKAEAERLSATAAPAPPGPPTADFVPPPRADVPVATPAAAPTVEQGWGDWIAGLATSLGDGTRQGASMVLGAPVDLVNNAPRLANLLPGVDGVGPITEEPIGGRETIDAIMRSGSLIQDYEPRTGAERVVNRVGEELGATAIPVAGAIGKASTMPMQTVNRMAATPSTVGEGISGMFLQPAKVNPQGLALREGTYATAAGTGAGLSNEAFGDDRGWLSDLLGSLGGAGALAAGSAVTGLARNLYAGATGQPGYMDKIAGESVTDALINNSSQMQEQFARTGTLDTQALVEALRRPAPIEDAVPGYRANIGDRTQDPGLSTYAYNQDAVSPGAANARRASNDGAVNERMAGLAPEGDQARLRADLQTSVDRQIAEAASTEEIARLAFEEAAQGALPGMRDATARGSSIRSGLVDAKTTAQDNYRQLYAPVNEAQVTADYVPLRDRFDGIDKALPINDRERFRPTEANVPGRIVPEGANEAPAPLSEALALRSGLSQDIRKQAATGDTQAARVAGQYKASLEEFITENLPPDLKAQLDAANAARRDVADRFERPGTGVADALRPREGGGYSLDDSAVPGRFAQPDQGRLVDLRALLREAGNDPRVRTGLADEVLADVQSRGLLDRPAALGKYLSDRSVLLGEFPEMRSALEKAGATRADLAAAERAARDTQTRLTTPGRSATASYLKFSDDAAGDAIRTVTTSPRPKDAVREILGTAASPTARIDLRTALWAEISKRGRMEAPGLTGETRWNGKRLRAMFDDPKFKAVAEELWADDPEDLADIQTVFGALARAEGSTRARAAGTSGTAQSLSGKLDPSMSVTSIASRARSVSRGQLSPAIAVVDVISVWLRNKSLKVQSRAIDQIASAVVNNPRMAADLLERYNPATAPAYGRMMTQKYGMRGTQMLNILDEAQNDDPVLEAIGAD